MYVMAIIMILSSYISVFFWGRSSIKPSIPIVVIPPESSWVFHWKPIFCFHDTVITEHETLYIDSTTHLGDIPLRVKRFINDIPLLIGGKPYRVSIGEAFTYRGIAYQDSVWTIPVPFEVELPKEPKPFPIQPYCFIGLDYCWATTQPAHLKFSGEVGLAIYKRFDIHASTEYETVINQVKVETGGRWYPLRGW